MAVIEEQNKDEQFGPFYDDLRRLATATVMMAVASIEGYTNELFADAAQNFEPGALDSWLRAARKIDRKPVLDKCDWFLSFRSKPGLDRDKRPTRDIQCLVDLRNELVHFHPEWHDESRRHAELSETLKGKFPPLKWLKDDPGIFPRAWTSHACARWAVQSSVDFIDGFCGQADLTTPLDQFRKQLATEFVVVQ